MSRVIRIDSTAAGIYGFRQLQHGPAAGSSPDGLSSPGRLLLYRPEFSIGKARLSGFGGCLMRFGALCLRGLV